MKDYCYFCFEYSCFLSVTDGLFYKINRSLENIKPTLYPNENSSSNVGQFEEKKGISPYDISKSYLSIPM